MTHFKSRSGISDRKNEKTLSELAKTIEKQSERIGSIEKLLKMMIVNGLIREIDESICDSFQKVDSQIEDLLLDEGVNVGNFFLINGKKILSIQVPEELTMTVSKVIGIQERCKSMDKTLDICFFFKTLHGIQRKRFLEEHISFCIDGEEIHIFSK